MHKQQNHAAALSKAQAYPLQVLETPYVQPGPNELCIRVHALAVNPVDHILQTQGTSLGFGWLKYPLILGSDVAGTVVEIGSAVNNLKVGDRVLGQCLGTDKAHNSSQNAEAGFQQYSILQANMTCKIPDSLQFENACTLPLGLSTASCALFQKDQQGLVLPSANVETKRQTILIWGGSTSVGVNAIQLAVAAGYDVVTTCSPSNFDLCRSLGAKQCFNYKSPKVEDEIVTALTSDTCLSALAIGTNSALPCIRILARHKNRDSTQRKFLSLISGPSFPEPTESLAFLKLISRFISFGMSLSYTAWRNGVGWKFVFGTSLAANEVGPAIYNDFLPGALRDGRFKALPEPIVVGTGLEKVQLALDTLKKGVSAKKIVVKLE